MNDTDKTTRRSARSLVRRALLDGISWQESFAEANHPGTPERGDALVLVAQYRAMLMRRYGERLTPMEAAFEGCPTVDIRDVRLSEEPDVQS